MTPGTPGDALVIGAGAAGLLAALHAAALGVRVTLLDPSDATRSNLVASSGLFSAAGTRFQRAQGIVDSPDLWADDARRKAQGAIDPTILRLATTRSADVADLLADRLGLPVTVQAGLTLPGHSVPRLHEALPEGGGAALAARLFAAARAHPGIAFRRLAATALIAEDGAVRGVQTDEGPLRASWTLLASGGFGANRELLARYAPEVLQAVYIGLGPNDGRAHGWGTSLGGSLAQMDGYQGQGHTLPDGSGRLGPGLTGFGAIVVNNHGERFADDGMGPSEFAACVLAQPGGIAVEVFDDRIHARALSLSTYRDVHARGLVVAAPDAPALAAAFGLPPERLAATLARHDAVVAGQPDPFGRTAALHALRPPYRAARITGALAHTQGGLLVDGAARVRRGDAAIPGLLAAGATVAGISGHGAPGYLPGNGLGHAFALALVAAETMARRLPQPAPTDDRRSLQENTVP